MTKRRQVAYRIDERILEVINTLAQSDNTSPNKLIEKHFFKIGKDLGLIAQSEQLLGETRGLSRRKKDEV